MRSYVTIPTAEIPRLKNSHLKLLAVLLEFADRNGKCWPSLRAIAKASGMSLSRVPKSLSQMESLGYFERTSRAGSFVYQIAKRFLVKVKSTIAIQPRDDRRKSGNCPLDSQGYPQREATNAIQKESERIHRPSIEPKESVAARDEGFSTRIVNPVLRRFASPKPPGLASNIKEQLRCKLIRYCRAKLFGEGLHRATDGLCGCDPDPAKDAQWWLDQVDRRMKAERWDDTREWKRRNLQRAAA